MPTVKGEKVLMLAIMVLLYSTYPKSHPLKQKTKHETIFLDFKIMLYTTNANNNSAPTRLYMYFNTNVSYDISVKDANDDYKKST